MTAKSKAVVIVTEAAIEAATKFQFEDQTDLEWAGFPEKHQQIMREAVKGMLEAAAPHMAMQR